MQWRQLVRQHRRVQSWRRLRLHRRLYGCALREIRAPRQLQQSLRPPVPTRRRVHWHRHQAVRMRLPQRRPELREEGRDLLRARRLHLLRERRLVQSRWRVRLRRGIHRQHLRRDRPRVDEAKARWILGREQEGGHQRRRRGGGPAVPNHRGRLRVHVLHGAKGTKRRAALHEARRLARAAARARFGDERAKRAPGTTRPSSQGVNPSCSHVT
mmetsp:Transcript_11394/g.31730  ORF Transcript_11394/g.31730 Transcript_11394/m.31730 type:complete len:213 (-) Transcript_11394:163-801(-)